MAASTDFNPLTQNITILGPDQSEIEIPLADIDGFLHSSFAQAINFAVQLGALFITLITMLVMTPKSRFKVLPVAVNLAALVATFIRMALLMYYFVSDWQHIYVIFSGDYSSVPRSDYNTSIAATVFMIPVTVLVELALIVQARSTLRLWPRALKIITACVSLLLVVPTIAFNIAVVIMQVGFILYSSEQYEWLQKVYVVLLTCTICWFAFLFIARLVWHMWETRSILVKINGINSMDALVLSNAIVIVIPVIFVTMQFFSSVDFLAFTLAQTSVVIVLPIGSLVAQRLSNPGAFYHNSNPADAGGSAGANSSRGGAVRPPNANGGGGGDGRVLSSNSGKPLLMGRSNPSQPDSVGSAANGVRSAYLGVSTEARYDGERRGSAPDSAYEKELEQIDHLDVELGEMPPAREARGGVRVERTFESSEERVGAAGI
ncbi:Fungal pheromone mating factor STE2 GPCR domain containing protein [Naviculisporaceae sp. PSN 640]